MRKLRMTKENWRALDILLKNSADDTGEVMPFGNSEQYHARKLYKLGFLVKNKDRFGMMAYWPAEGAEKKLKENFKWAGMENRRMQEMLCKGEALDLSECVRTNGGEYVIEGMTGDEILNSALDFCNAVTEDWIWSIGEHKETKKVYASHSSNKYLNPAFRCVWLR